MSASFGRRCCRGLLALPAPIIALKWHEMCAVCDSCAKAA